MIGINAFASGTSAAERSGDAAVASQWLAAFVQRLGELGWVDGRNVTIEVRWAEGRGERVAQMRTS
jgi:putative ABC transport system substrate-binding protein